MSPGVDSFIVKWGDGIVESGLTTIPNNHTYSKGLYDLFIIAIGSNGCIDSKTYIVANQGIPGLGVGAPPSTELCAPDQLPFQLSNYGSNAPGTYYIWNFGDSSALVTWDYEYPLNTTNTIYHQYQNTSCGQPNNEFTVTVQAINYCAVRTATVDGVRIYEGSQTDFEIVPNLGCTDTTLFCFNNFSNPGIGPDPAGGVDCSAIGYYIWNFGDGSPEVTTVTGDPDPCHMYDSPGTYTVTLKAYNEAAVCDTSIHTETITVNTVPTSIIQASDTTGCVPLAVTFNSGSSTGRSLSYHWEVQPPTGWNFIAPYHADSVITRINFTVPNAYQVFLITTNNCGTDTTLFTVIVGGDVSIALPPIPNACDTFTYYPNALIDRAYGSLDTITWLFPGGTPSISTQLDPGPVFYSSPGTYTVTVSTITSCGTANASRTFQVHQSPVADFGAAAVCLGDSMYFTDSSQQGSSPVTAWFWDFGDGTTATTADPAHLFATCGPHTVSLSITDANAVRTIRPSP
ncbi:MAG: hypothetical protein OHK0039_18110 [Bacteroidia bacterium]